MLLFKILVSAFYLFGFNLIVWKWNAIQFRYFKPIVSVAFFNLKVLAGVGLWLIYTFYYKDIARNDAHKYFNDAVTLQEIRNENASAFCELMFTTRTNNYAERLNHWNRNFDEAPINENRTIIRLQSLIMFASFRIYFVHILFMCFVSFLGYVLLVNTLTFFFISKINVLWIAVLSLPSVLFWSSGVMKEPLLILGIGVFVSGLLGERKPFLKIIWIAASVLIILSTKFYVLAALLPAAVAFSIARNRNHVKFIIGKYFLVYGLLVLLAFNSQHFFQSLNFAQMLVNKQTYSIREAEYFDAGSRTDIQCIENNISSVVSAMPAAIRNVLFRPYVCETRKPLMLINAVENLLILALIVFAISKTDFRELRSLNLLLFLLTSSLTFFALVGMTTPVLGNLVRYKVPMLPLFLSAFLLNAKLRENRFIEKFFVRQD
jgi:hypothetical protein